MPMVILGNKGDMVHLRQVSSEEGNILGVMNIEYRYGTPETSFIRRRYYSENNGYWIYVDIMTGGNCL